MANSCKEMVLVFFFFIIVEIIVLPFSVVGAFRIVVNSEGKTESEGSISTHVAGICGQDYCLVTPESADIWEINITITSELSTQPVHIRIYEVIGEYPYNYEEQTDVPYAKGTGTANLVVLLNTSKIYEIWISDAYAKQFTGTIREIWHPYVINGDFEDPLLRPFGIPGWEHSGHISSGVGPDTYKESRCVGLFQDYNSHIWQNVNLNRKDLVLSFWFLPRPKGSEIRLKVLVDNTVLFDRTFSGEDAEYKWTNVIIFLEPLFEFDLNYGEHQIELLIPKSNFPVADRFEGFSFDEVSIFKVADMEKIDTELWCEIDENYIDFGESIGIFGTVHIRSDKIVSLSGFLSLELDFSFDEGENWWFIEEATIDQNNEFQTVWEPSQPGEYIIRTVILDNQYFSEFEAWTEPLIVGTIVNIDSYNVSTTRCDLGSSQYVKIHASYAHNDADASNVVIVVNGSEYISDETGWINIFSSINTIGKSIWNIDSIKNVDGYNILVENPTIIWDKIEILMSPQRIDINSDDIEWSGKYRYNNELFQGFLILNNSLLKNNYKVMGISDPNYGLTNFIANDFEVIFDRVNIELTTSNNRINAGEEPDISVSAYYEYDSMLFQGSISFVQPLSNMELGEYEITVEGINDPLYSLTTFTQNEVKCIWDRINIIDSGVSQESTIIKNSETVWYKAEYEYDSETFDGSKGILYLNGEPLEWSSLNSRWEKKVSSDIPITKTFEVTSVEDNKYELTTFIDTVGPLSIQWRQQEITGFPSESIIIGVIVGIFLIGWIKIRF